MFRGATNPYDEPVAKTTDENLTGENWELILNLCDKVTDEGETGAREVIAALIKRLAHRNPNVQLYSLALAEALSKNCGIELHRELASRAFTACLERMITDRTTHDKVKKRALTMIQQWASDFENDPSLGLMEDLYTNLRTKNYKFDTAPPPEVDDSLKKKEEEELQRVLELSLVDKGGRSQWYGGGGYVAAGGSGSAAAAGPSGSRNASTSNLHSTTGASSSTVTGPSIKPVPVKATPTSHPTIAPVVLNKPHGHDTTTSQPASVASTSPKSTNAALISRVRALHTFEPTEIGELAFEKGDIIKVVDRGYKDWWRGQLKGKTGIFPVNYVEPLPEPTQADIAKEAQMEADVFTQAPSIDRLLTMLRGLDPLKDNLADNDELQELYRQTMSLRPKIVKLIDKYTQKRLELTSMSDNFKQARQLFEVMMEESLAKHSPGVMYDYRQPGPPQNPAYDYQSGQPNYGWNPNPAPMYNPQAPGLVGPPAVTPQPQFGGYPPNAPPQGPYPTNAPGQNHSQDYVQPYGPAPPVDPQSAYAQQYGPQYVQQPPPAAYQPAAEQQQTGVSQGQGQAPQTQTYGGYPGPQYGQQGPGQQPQQQIAPGPQPQQPQQAPGQQAAPPTYGQPVLGQVPPGPGYQVGPAADHTAYGQPSQQQQQQPGAAPQPQTRTSLDNPPQQQQAQPPPPQQQQPQYAQYQTAAPQEVHAQAQGAAPQQQQTPAQGQGQGQEPAQQQQQQQPPFVWARGGTYPDPGAQAWAEYYAMGGNDPAGRVYFTPESLPPLQTDASGQGPALSVTEATPTSGP